MLQAYEGYLEKGRVYTLKPLANVQERRRVIITVLDETIQNMPDTWDELDRLVSSMDEKPRLEDFPRCQLGRESVSFEEV